MKKKKTLFAAFLSILSIKATTDKHNPFGFNVHGNMYIPLDDDALEFVVGGQVASGSYLSDIIASFSGGIRFYDEDISAAAILSVPLLGNKLTGTAKEYLRHVCLSLHVAWELSDIPNLMIGIQANISLSGVGVGIIISKKINRYEIGGSLYYIKELEIWKDKENSKNTSTITINNNNNNDGDKPKVTNPTNKESDNEERKGLSYLNNEINSIFEENIPDNIDKNSYKTVLNILEMFITDSANIASPENLQESPLTNAQESSDADTNLSSELNYSEHDDDYYDNDNKDYPLMKRFLILKTEFINTLKEKDLNYIYELNPILFDSKLAFCACENVFESNSHDWIKLLEDLKLINVKNKTIKRLIKHNIAKIEQLTYFKTFEKEIISQVNRKIFFKQILDNMMYKDDFFMDFYPECRKQVLDNYIENRVNQQEIVKGVFCNDLTVEQLKADYPDLFEIDDICKFEKNKKYEKYQFNPDTYWQEFLNFLKKENQKAVLDETPDAESPNYETANHQILDCETPEDETPDAEALNNETPEDETPDDEALNNETPDDETPDDEALNNETPDDEALNNETPDAETPDAEALNNETPEDETSDAETSNDEAPDGETSNDETPDDETPNHETADDQTSGKKNEKDIPDGTANTDANADATAGTNPNATADADADANADSNPDATAVQYQKAEANIADGTTNLDKALGAAADVGPNQKAPDENNQDLSKKQKIKNWIIENNSVNKEAAKKKLKKFFDDLTFQALAHEYLVNLEFIIKHIINNQEQKIQSKFFTQEQINNLKEKIKSELEFLKMRNVSYALACTELNGWTKKKSDSNYYNLKVLNNTLFHFANDCLFENQRKEEKIIRKNFKLNYSLNKNKEDIYAKIQEEKFYHIFSEDDVFTILNNLWPKIEINSIREEVEKLQKELKEYEKELNEKNQNIQELEKQKQDQQELITQQNNDLLEYQNQISNTDPSKTKLELNENIQNLNQQIIEKNLIIKSLEIKINNLHELAQKQDQNIKKTSDLINELTNLENQTEKNQKQINQEKTKNNSVLNSFDKAMQSVTTLQPLQKNSKAANNLANMDSDLANVNIVQENNPLNQLLSSATVIDPISTEILQENSNQISLQELRKLQEIVNPNNTKVQTESNTKRVQELKKITEPKPETLQEALPKNINPTLQTEPETLPIKNIPPIEQAEPLTINNETISQSKLIPSDQYLIPSDQYKKSFNEFMEKVCNNEKGCVANFKENLKKNNDEYSSKILEKINKKIKIDEVLLECKKLQNESDNSSQKSKLKNLISLLNKDQKKGIPSFNEKIELEINKLSFYDFFELWSLCDQNFLQLIKQALKIKTVKVKKIGIKEFFATKHNDTKSFYDITCEIKLLEQIVEACQITIAKKYKTPIKVLTNFYKLNIENKKFIMKKLQLKPQGVESQDDLKNVNNDIKERRLPLNKTYYPTNIIKEASEIRNQEKATKNTTQYPDEAKKSGVITAYEVEKNYKKKIKK